MTNARLPRGGGGHVTYGQFDAAGPRDDAEFIAIQRLTMAADDGARGLGVTGGWVTGGIGRGGKVIDRPMNEESLQVQWVSRVGGTSGWLGCDPTWNGVVGFVRTKSVEQRF